MDDSRDGWVRASKAEGPKTLDQIHRDAASEDMSFRSNTMRSLPGPQMPMSRYNTQDDGDFVSGNRRGPKRNIQSRDMHSGGRYDSSRYESLQQNGRMMEYEARNPNGVGKSSSRTLAESHKRPVDSFFPKAVSSAASSLMATT